MHLELTRLAVPNNGDLKYAHCLLNTDTGSVLPNWYSNSGVSIQMTRVVDLTNEQLEYQLQRYLKRAINPGGSEDAQRIALIVKKLRAEILRRSNQSALIGNSSRASLSGEVNVYFDEGLMALKSGRYEEAERAFLTLAKRDPKSADAWSGLAICKLYQLANGRTMEEVMFAFGRAKQVQPQRASDVDRLVLEHASQVVHAYYGLLSQSVASARSAQNKAALGGVLAVVSVIAGTRSSANAFVQLASLGVGGAGVGIALNSLSTISDIKVLQSTVVNHILAIKTSVDEFVDRELPEYSHFNDLLTQIQTPNNSSRKLALPFNGKRRVSFWLGVGIFFMPYIFAWFTLRKGHTRTARVVSLAWLAWIVLLYSIGLASQGRR